MGSYIPSYSSYYQNVKQLEHKTHDLQITFAKNYYENLNYHRESITLYYLKRA